MSDYPSVSARQEAIMFTEERQSRRGLSRTQVPGFVYFVTYRLAGSIAQGVLEDLCANRRRWLRQFALRGANPAGHLPAAHKLLFGQLDDLLDRPAEGAGLALPEAALAVRDSLLRHDGAKYKLLAYCVMPSHVHALIRLDNQPDVDEPAVIGEQPDAGGPLAEVMAAWKQATARQAGLAWHPDSYLQRVRDDEELDRLVDYIAYNPVKAGLARQVHEWPWCSARDRFLSDGRETAWLPAAV
jgi:putative transposase